MTGRPRSTVHVPMLALVLVLAAAGCARKASDTPRPAAPADTSAAPEAFAAIAADVESRLATLALVEGRLDAGGGGEIRWSAWFDGPALLHLRERMDVPDVGWGETGYWWKDGVLRIYREAGVTKGMHGARAASDTLERAILLDAAGGVVHATQSVNGTASELPAERVEAVRRRAAEMADVARKTRGGTPRP
uniref:Lipoprotein n=1 Tax=Eiseniibacteriota bacterium TaxID=2212470 RepID=A0A832I871_UNCEI